ncbi:hypothetical protein ABIE65_000159 [Constrictibacter sp. MBR-5]|jgi:hypothetical protein|uniref:DUF4159 domain-containing protein n=1 Tax=Constrictibacter sp. MBR-5 TaxID=3156467 RepID=UPI00339775F0
MLQLGPLAFLSAPILGALLLLPLIWWILRISPPAPRMVRFPAIRLLFGLRQDEETPARTPLWLLLLRMLLAALVILALAHPILNPAVGRIGTGPILIVVDDGWAAARNWPARIAAVDALLDDAERTERPVVLLTTAAAPSGEPPPELSLQRAADVRAAVRALEPKPWPVDRAAAARRLDGLSLDAPASVRWIAEGVEGQDVAVLARRLQRFGRLEVVTDPRAEAARLIRAPRRDGLTLTLVAERAAAIGPERLFMRGLATDGRTVLREELAFAPDATQAETARDLPSEILNALAVLRIDEEPSAGATFLLDEGWRRRPVGIAVSGAVQSGHPLLDDLHYLTRALATYTDLRRGSLSELLDGRLAVIAITDAVTIPDDVRPRLDAWVEAGGVLLRFAGPDLSDGRDDLLPVTLRVGGRALGGALSWSQPQPLSGFAADGPFAGLAPQAEVTVSRQLLAEPSIDLVQKTWASLADGTPLVTGAPNGKGWLVLFHTTASADWSSLPMSGLFVQMLQRIVALSQGVTGGDAEGPLPPVEVLDGAGRLERPTRPIRPIAVSDMLRTAPGPDRPPGFYGDAAGVRAFNLSPSLAALTPFPRDLPGGVAIGTFGRGTAERDLKPWLLVGAVLLALADLMIALGLRGHLTGLGRPLRRTAAVSFVAAAGLAAGLAAGAPLAEAQTAEPSVSEEAALAATLKTHLAYVRTGVADVDRISRAGLGGLSRTLSQRTSIEPGDPIEVDIETDELAFFPLLYWPVMPEQPALTSRAHGRLLAYLQNGGTVLFDTRDQGAVAGTLDLGAQLVTPEGRKLREILRGVNLPSLTPVPPDHVLTKAFYLLHDFPGRWTGGSVWVEATSGNRNDGVSPVIIGGHDWAGAWATGPEGQPLLPVVPGGEQQREMAWRFGVNLVMHVLTGNYKTDQVHVPAILERLGE